MRARALHAHMRVHALQHCLAKCRSDPSSSSLFAPLRISCFHDDNTIHLLRGKWAQQVSEGSPVVCEGALCTSRLQILAHTVAHEMVHALVFHFMPEVDKASEAYLPDERHGPIFKLINKRVFGHASDSYHHVFQQPRSIEC